MKNNSKNYIKGGYYSEGQKPLKNTISIIPITHNDYYQPQQYQAQQYIQEQYLVRFQNEPSQHQLPQYIIPEQIIMPQYNNIQQQSPQNQFTQHIIPQQIIVPQYHNIQQQQNDHKQQLSLPFLQKPTYNQVSYISNEGGNQLNNQHQVQILYDIQEESIEDQLEMSAKIPEELDSFGINAPHISSYRSRANATHEKIKKKVHSKDNLEEQKNNVEQTQSTKNILQIQKNSQQVWQEEQQENQQKNKLEQSIDKEEFEKQNNEVVEYIGQDNSSDDKEVYREESWPSSLVVNEDSSNEKDYRNLTQEEKDGLNLAIQQYFLQNYMQNTQNNFDITFEENHQKKQEEDEFQDDNNDKKNLEENQENNIEQNDNNEIQGQENEQQNLEERSNTEGDGDIISQLYDFLEGKDNKGKIVSQNHQDDKKESEGGNEIFQDPNLGELFKQTPYIIEHKQEDVWDNNGSENSVISNQNDQKIIQNVVQQKQEMELQINQLQDQLKETLIKTQSGDINNCIQSVEKTLKEQVLIEEKDLIKSADQFNLDQGAILNQPPVDNFNNKNLGGEKGDKAFDILDMGRGFAVAGVIKYSMGVIAFFGMYLSAHTIYSYYKDSSKSLGEAIKTTVNAQKYYLEYLYHTTYSVISKYSNLNMIGDDSYGDSSKSMNLTVAYTQKELNTGVENQSGAYYNITDDLGEI